MKTAIIMIERQNLISAKDINHRQAGARKIIGKQWLENLPPLTVADNGNDTYTILNGNRRFEYLTECQSFPCIVVQCDVSTAEGVQHGIEKYKGDSLALSLADVVRFGLDKVKWQVGKYLAKDGETLFLSDMVNFYEDYHPCTMANDSEDKENQKKLRGFHKGLNQSVYRACMLGGSYAQDYIDKVKGVSTALRAGFDSARKAQMRGLSWSDSKLEALTSYQAEIEKVANKEKKESTEVDGIGNYISRFAVTLNEAEMDETEKKHYGKLLLCVVANDVEGFMREILG